MRGQIRHALITAAGFHSHGHAATAKPEISQLGDRHLMLSQHVVTDHAKLRLAVSDVDGHVTVANQQSPGSTANGWNHQLTIVGIQHR